MHYVDGIPVFGTHDEKTLNQIRDVASRAARAALLADAHVGFTMPIGGVAAYDEKVSPVGNGFDIACGNAAIRTDLRLGEMGVPSTREELSRVADEIWDVISFGIGRKNRAGDAPADHPLFSSGAWSLIPGRHEQDSLKAKARNQLGTVGAGNHYVDVFADEAGYLWVGVHFGSRGFGHTVATGFLNLSQGRKWSDKNPKEVEVLLDLSTPIGHDYWHLMELAGQYAYAGREWVARKVVGILGGREMEIVHNHHNYSWREMHRHPEGGEAEFVVTRKGSTPAFPGQKGFIGGSMGGNAVIVQGKVGADTETREMQDAALFSTVHGAGRVMSRTVAAGKRDWKTKAIKSPGLISPEMMYGWLEKKGVILRGGGLDEAPQAYRRRFQKYLPSRAQRLRYCTL